MALERVPDLIRAGVSCLKIEGRLKGPEYVAITVQAYRQAVDAAWQHIMSEMAERLQSSEEASAVPELISDEQRKALHQVWST